MKNITFAILTVIMGVQVGVAHAAPDANGKARATASASHSVQQSHAEKPGVNWDFASGHDASGVPVLRS